MNTSHHKNIFYFNLLLLLLSIIYIIKFKTLLLLLFLIFSIFYIICELKNIKKIFFVILPIIFIILLLFIPNLYNIKYLVKLLDDRTSFFYLRNTLVDFIEESYPEKISSFINLLLFNKKTYNSNIVDMTTSLNIIHIFVISGLHINLITFLLSKVFKKIPKINFLVNLLVVFFICYMVNFSISSLRVFFTILISFFFKKKDISNINKTSIVAILFISIFINDSTSFSFILTFCATITVNWVSEKWKNNNILKVFLINILVSLSTIPIIIYFNNGFYLLFLLSSFIFSFLIIFVFMILLISVWIPFLFKVNIFIISNVYSFIELFYNFEQNLYVKIKPICLIFFYLIWFFIINRFKKNNNFLCKEVIYSIKNNL